MSRRGVNQKGRRNKGTFVAVPHDVLNHPNYIALSHRARSLLMDLYAQYRSWKDNNGDLCAAWTVMSKRGWKSKDQLQKAKTELLENGWIVLTRQGGRNLASLYGVTFQPLGECGGKLDRPASAVALGYWKLGYNPELETLSFPR